MIELLEQIYQELNRFGLVENRCEFSSFWLNKSRRYCSMIRASGRSPSVEAMQTLVARLQQFDDAVGSYDPVRAERLNEMAQKARQEVNRCSLLRQPHKHLN